MGRNDEEIGDRNVDIFDRALKCKQVASQILSLSSSSSLLLLETLKV